MKEEGSSHIIIVKMKKLGSKTLPTYYLAIIRVKYHSLEHYALSVRTHKKS